MRYVDIKLKGRIYECFIECGSLVDIYEKISLMEKRNVFIVPKLSGLWLRIVALLAEKGELNV